MVTSESGWVYSESLQQAVWCKAGVSYKMKKKMAGVCQPGIDEFETKTAAVQTSGSSSYY